MTATAVTTLFVHQLMPQSPFYGLSPLHLLIPLTLFGVFGALHGAWTRNIAEHKRAMIALYIGAIVIAGSLTLLPGRIIMRSCSGTDVIWPPLKAGNRFPRRAPA